MKNLKLKLAAVASLVLTAAPGAARAGYYYEAVTTNGGPGAGGSEVSTVHAWVDGDSAKVEFQQSAQAGMFQAGSYIVTQDAGSTLYLVNPAEMTIATLDLDQLLGVAGAMMEAMGGIVNMEFSGFSSETISEEPGGQILGYDTTLSHHRTGYTMSISVMGFARESRIETENRVWCSDEFDAGGLRVWLRPDRFRTGNDDFDELIRQQYETMNCVPLRTEVVTTTTSNGDQSVSTTTTEVQAIREENVAASVFALPEGYERVSIMEGITGSPPPAEQQQEQGTPSFRDLLRGFGR